MEVTSLAAGVTAALFILQRTPSDGSEEGCSPLITAALINSFIHRRLQTCCFFLFLQFPQLKM